MSLLTSPKSCLKKKLYLTLRSAERKAAYLTTKRNKVHKAYCCNYCQFWHLSTITSISETKIETVPNFEDLWTKFKQETKRLK